MTTLTGCQTPRIKPRPSSSPPRPPHSSNSGKCTAPSHANTISTLGPCNGTLIGAGFFFAPLNLSCLSFSAFSWRLLTTGAKSILAQSKACAASNLVDVGEGMGEVQRDASSRRSADGLQLACESPIVCADEELPIAKEFLRDEEEDEAARSSMSEVATEDERDSGAAGDGGGGGPSRVRRLLPLCAESE